MAKKRLKLIEQDPWLEPSEQDIEDRHDRFVRRLKDIIRDFGSLKDFANGHNYFGINHDPVAIKPDVAPRRAAVA